METQQCDRPDVRAELHRIAVALRDGQRPECYRELYAAQQALCWALEPNGAAPPFDVIMGIHEPTTDCSDVPHPQSS